MWLIHCDIHITLTSSQATNYLKSLFNKTLIVFVSNSLRYCTWRKMTIQFTFNWFWCPILSLSIFKHIKSECWYKERPIKSVTFKPNNAYPIKMQGMCRKQDSNLRPSVSLVRRPYLIGRVVIKKISSFMFIF